MKTVTVICGLPNAGKTTYSRKYKNVVHLDTVIEDMKNVIPNIAQRNRYSRCIELAIASENNICVEGGYDTTDLRKRFISALKTDEKKCKLECVWINTPIQECLRRSEQGARSAFAVKSHAKIFEVPVKEEGWDELKIISE